MEEQVVVFRLNREEYAISISQAKEIIVYRDTTNLPHTPDYMEGVINVRGKIIPIISIAAKFGLSSSKRADRKVIIVEVGSQEIGKSGDRLLILLEVEQLLADDELVAIHAATI